VRPEAASQSRILRARVIPDANQSTTSSGNIIIEELAEDRQREQTGSIIPFGVSRARQASASARRIGLAVNAFFHIARI
jgi:hypothetical protein